MESIIENRWMLSAAKHLFILNRRRRRKLISEIDQDAGHNQQRILTRLTTITGRSWRWRSAGYWAQLAAEYRRRFVRAIGYSAGGIYETCEGILCRGSWVFSGTKKRWVSHPGGILGMGRV
jgi:hypothetical protein